MQWRWWRRHREWSTKCQSTAPNRLDVIIFFFDAKCLGHITNRNSRSRHYDADWSHRNVIENECRHRDISQAIIDAFSRRALGIRTRVSMPANQMRPTIRTGWTDRTEAETKPQTNNSKNTSFSPQHIRWLTTCARRRNKRREKYARRQFRAHRNTHHIPFGCSCNDKQA